jgi:hypothetical protein
VDNLAADGLAAEGLLTIRVAYNLFTTKPKREKEEFLNWTNTSKYKEGEQDSIELRAAGDLRAGVETFLLESWLEHLRQHERVTNADRLAQEAVQQFQLSGAPKVTHFIGAEL